MLVLIFVCACMKLLAFDASCGGRCAKPQALKDALPAWRGCNNMPEALHPKSFRGTFGHNTNVWATKQAAKFKLQVRASWQPHML